MFANKYRRAACGLSIATFPIASWKQTNWKERENMGTEEGWDRK